MITVQVQPQDTSPAAVFGNINGIKSVWEFDNQTKKWRTYRFGAGAAEKNALPGVGIQNIGFGKAYWLEVANQSNPNLTGDIPVVAPAVQMHAGWNLIGLPVAGPSGNNQLSEQVPLVAALSLKGLDYDTLLKWQAEAPTAPGYKKNRFGTTAGGGAATNEEEFQNFEPNRGYWINVTAAQSIQPDLLAIGRGDVDMTPTGNFPNGPEDLNVSGGSIPVAAADQTKIVFFEGEDVQQISFSNEGGGIMLWEVEWVPTDATGGTPWISLSAGASDPSAAQTMTGVTSVETENIYLRLNRKDLPKGKYTGTLNLKTSAGTRSYSVEANVGGLEGEWKGFAEITSVNGKRNKVPDIDLNISFFEDVTTAGLLRGAIDSSQSILWPVDVQLVGHITGNQGNGFQLGGAYVLPPGDQNQQPFDVWDPTATGNDVDWDNDNKYEPADRINPYPFPIYRSVTLEGLLVTANPVDDEGYVISGTYREIIYGMMRKPIELVGKFTLTRKSATPFDSLKKVVTTLGGGATSPISTGTNLNGESILSSQSKTQQVIIGADMILRDVRVSFDIAALSGALTSTNINVTLTAPSGHSVVLHDGSAIDSASLRGASYPDVLTPLGTAPKFDDFLTSVTDTSGNWEVSFVNNTGQTIIVKDVSITIMGQPVTSIYGRVTNGAGAGVPGADIALLGLPYSEIFEGVTDAGGNFVIHNVPAMPVNLAASLPGYGGGNSLIASQLVPSFASTNDEEARFASRFVSLPAVPVGSLGVSGFESNGSNASNPLQLELIPEPGSVEIVSFPDYGMAGLEVKFNAVRASGSVSWDFGDGNNGAGTSVSHTYSAAGVYTVTMTDDNGSITDEVVVLPSPGHTPTSPSDVVGNGGIYGSAGNYTTYVFSPRFSGGGSLPASGIIPTNATPQDYPNAAPAADLVMVQHTYTANTDIDLAPTVNGNPPLSFGSDNFTSGTNYWSSILNNQPSAGNGITNLLAEDADPGTAAPFHDPGWTHEDHNYLLWPAKWYRDSDGNGKLDQGEIDFAGYTNYDQNDGLFENPHPTSGLVPPLEVTNYRMVCNIGSTISPVGITGASVRSVDADPVTSPPLQTGPSNAGVGGNLHYSLHTNLLVIPSVP